MSPARNTSTLDLHDTRCPHCGAAPLRATEPGAIRRDEPGATDNEGIQHGAIRCDQCGAHYDLIWGAPFLGAFDSQDTVGLIEIAANARADNGYPDAPTIRRLERLLVSYHTASDRVAFVRDEPDEFVRAPWFLNRYHEWLHFTTLAAGISFVGKRVLDVGAGTGVDSYRIVTAGADVTALEYNPMLVRRGLEAVPEARWFGGLSHALPFVSGSFDIVCCNAALHHMRDVSTSLQEMLRVLKPDGWLITTGDPYRARHLGEDHELAVFNRHPAVLLGVNESIPSFAAFESALAKHRHGLEIEIATAELSPPQSNRSRSRFARITDAANTVRRILGGRPISDRTAEDATNGVQWWDFDRDRHTVGNSSGSIALRCRVKRAMHIAPNCQGETVLSAGDYAESLTDYQQAIQKLAPHVPTPQVNCPFPGDVQTKFALLNGWLAPTGNPERTAYRRARWFLRRTAEADALTFSARHPNTSPAANNSISVFVNGARQATVALATDDWHDITLSVRQVPLGEIFVVEIQLDSGPATFDDGLFEIRDQRFNASAAA